MPLPKLLESKVSNNNPGPEYETPAQHNQNQQPMGSEVGQNYGAYQAPQAPYEQPGYNPYQAGRQYGYQQGYPYGGYPQGGPVPANSKSKLAAFLLAFFLGSLGIHNFYLGYTGRGLTQLAITLFSFGFLAVVTAIWALVEGILYLAASPGTKYSVDARGVPLS